MERRYKSITASSLLNYGHASIRSLRKFGANNTGTSLNCVCSWPTAIPVTLVSMDVALVPKATDPTHFVII